MKPTGIIRKVDELGRIVLPVELRRTLDISEKDELEFSLDGERIILRKAVSACVFCGSTRSLISHRDKAVCKKCLGQLVDL